MKELFILSFIFFILLSGLVSAQSSSQFNPQQSLQGALTQLAKYFPNDVIHIQITLNNGTTSDWQATTSNGQLVSFTSGSPPNPTVTITTTQTTLVNIASAQDQYHSTIQAINDGSITITSTSIVNQIKLFFFSIFTKLSSLFGGK